MKGVILAGGLGTRLHPLTKVTNKHLLPIYKKPMIYYPIEALVTAGIKDILVVTGGNSAGDFLKLLGNGSTFGLPAINYTYQEGEGGIADALRLARYFAGNDPICVILGDNIFEKSLSPAIEAYNRRGGTGAQIFLKKVDDPQRFGVPVFEKEKVVGIEEKPKEPKSSYAVTGIYIFDHRVFQIIETLKPSHRGELEITDVNNAYIELGEMHWAQLEGWWSDAGTFDSLLRASKLVSETGANNP